MTVPNNDVLACIGSIKQVYFNQASGERKARLNIYVQVFSVDGKKSMTYPWTVWEDLAESYSGIKEGMRIKIMGYASPYTDKEGKSKMSFTANSLEVAGYTPGVAKAQENLSLSEPDDVELDDSFL